MQPGVSSFHSSSPFLSRARQKVDDTLRTFFYGLGYVVAGHPWRTILLMLIIAGLGGSGLWRFRAESDLVKLWVPPNSDAASHKKFVDDTFGASNDVTRILFTPKNGSEPTSNKALLLDMTRVLSAIWTVSGRPVPPPEGNGNPVTLSSVCVERADKNHNKFCATFSILDLFYDPDLELDEGLSSPHYLANVASRLRAMSAAEVDEVVLNPAGRVQHKWDGAQFQRKNLVNTENGRIQGLLYFQITQSSVLVKKLTDQDPEVNSYEYAMLRVSPESIPNGEALSVEWFIDSPLSKLDAVRSSIVEELPLLAVGSGLLCLYVILFLGEFHIVHSRILLGVLAVSNSILAILFTYGVCSGLNTFYGPVHNMLPLLLLGIGIDDVLVITKTMSYRDSRANGVAEFKTTRDKVAAAVSHAGTAITVTSVTNAIVFLVGIASRLPALRMFSVWASVGVLADFMFSTTFFVACLTLDQRRIDQNRSELCIPAEEDNVYPRKNIFGIPFSALHLWFKDAVGPFLLNSRIRVVVLAFFGILTGVSCWGASQLYVKFDLALLFPRGSRPQVFHDKWIRLFEGKESSAVYVHDVDITDLDIQRQYLGLCDPVNGAIARHEYVAPDSVLCWYVAMKQFYEIGRDEVVPQADFLLRLHWFLTQPEGQPYIPNIARNANGTVKATSFSFVYVKADRNSQEIEHLKAIRAAVASSSLGDKAFPFALYDIMIEQYMMLSSEIATSLAATCAVVLVVCFIFIGHPLTALLSVFVVGVIVINVIGFLHFTTFNLNIITSVVLSLSVGLSVDFVIHVTHSFMDQEGTRAQRAIAALEEMGPPVLHAGVSTFLGIACLVASSSFVFRSVFWGMSTLVLFGLMCGLLLSPVLLSILGPERAIESKEAAAADMLSHIETAQQQSVLGECDQAGGAGLTPSG